MNTLLTIWLVCGLVLVIFVFLGALMQAIADDPVGPRMFFGCLLAAILWPLAGVIYLVGAVVHNQWEWLEQY